MEVFACDDYQQSFWMTTDPSAQCYTTPYWVALSVSCIVLALFTFGAPALAIGTVHKNKSLLAESETSRWLGVLYFEYVSQEVLPCVTQVHNLVNRFTLQL